MIWNRFKNQCKNSQEQENKMDENIKDTIGYRVTMAEWEGNAEFLKEMADSGQYDPLKITEYEKWNRLHLANFNPYHPSPPATIRFYLDKGVEVNAQDFWGRTPLHYAMEAKNGDAAMVLLEAGADPNIPDIDNIIPLAMIGAIPERLDVFKTMLERGGDVHFKNGNSGLELLEFWKEYCSEREHDKRIISLMEEYAN